MLVGEIRGPALSGLPLTGFAAGRALCAAFGCGLSSAGSAMPSEKTADMGHALLAFQLAIAVAVNKAIV